MPKNYGYKMSPRKLMASGKMSSKLKSGKPKTKSKSYSKSKN